MTTNLETDIKIICKFLNYGKDGVDVNFNCFSIVQQFDLKLLAYVINGDKVSKIKKF